MDIELQEHLQNLRENINVFLEFIDEITEEESEDHEFNFVHGSGDELDELTEKLHNIIEFTERLK